uniref:G protein-coupled receptor n=1 Tax=Panagrellus redivivus TaxID=6233 RepID=A0A7E4ZUI6_PANRE
MTLTVAEINGYTTTVDVLIFVNVIVELYLLFNIIFNSDSLSKAFTRTLLFAQFSLISLNVLFFILKPFVILPDVLLVPAGFFKLSGLTSRTIMTLLVVFFCFLVDTLIIITWERYFALLAIENNSKVVRYRIIVYCVTFIIDTASNLGYVYSTFGLTGELAVDELHTKSTLEMKEYLKLRQPNIVAFVDASTSVYIDVIVSGIIAFFGRGISTYCAVHSLKKYIHGKMLSSFTKNKLKLMTLVALSQAIVIVLVGILPCYGLMITGAIIPTYEYAEEIFLICWLIVMQMPLAIACITIYTVKPYQNALRKVLCMVYLKIFRKSVICVLQFVYIKLVLENGMYPKYRLRQRRIHNR